MSIPTVTAMSEEKPNPSNPQNPSDERTEPPPVKPRRRRWLRVLWVLVVVLVLLVLLAPTIASWGIARSVAQNIVNDNINGRAEIGGVSVGWFSPIHVTGIKVYGEDNRLILDVPSAKLNVTLLNALRQKFVLGEDSQI